MVGDLVTHITPVYTSIRLLGSLRSYPTLTAKQLVHWIVRGPPSTDAEWIIHAKAFLARVELQHGEDHGPQKPAARTPATNGQGELADVHRRHCPSCSSTRPTVGQGEKLRKRAGYSPFQPRAAEIMASGIFISEHSKSNFTHRTVR